MTSQSFGGLCARSWRDAVEVTQLKQERDVLRKSVAVFASDHGTWETMAK